MLFTIPSFTKTGLVKHGFTSRRGGVSSGHYSSLNLAFHVGDNPDCVRENRNKVLSIFGYSPDRLVAGEQVHGSQVYVVTAKDAGKGGTSLDTAIAGTDALITNNPGVLLSSYYADCVPLFFLDPEHKGIGLAHAGWKGTVQEIGVHTLKAMSENFGTDPGCCLAAVGPSIGPCCYQVDSHVYQRFAERFDYHQNFFKIEAEGKWKLNLQRANYEQLVRAGIRSENITVSSLCTACCQDIFFSYRKDQGKTGRQASLIMLAGES
ncbi:MAG: peptidoglycan editing factor PgeF [Bacillota bacterium]